jgi:hypothetical protein
MTSLLLVLTSVAAALDPNAMIQQAQQAAQQQGQAQQQTSTATGGGYNFRELKAPVIMKKNPKPAGEAKPKAPAEDESAAEGAGGKTKKIAGGGRAGSVRVPEGAGQWTPVGVRLGGGAGRNACSWRLKPVKIKGKKALKGETSPARATARWTAMGEDKKLIVSIFPKSLEERRVHLELRLPVVEGILERAELAAVAAEAGAGPLDDAAALKAKGIPFQEEFPASADLRLSALGKDNAGTIKSAEFAERLPNGLPGLGQLSCDFSAKEPK